MKKQNIKSTVCFIPDESCFTDLFKESTNRIIKQYEQKNEKIILEDKYD